MLFSQIATVVIAFTSFALHSLAIPTAKAEPELEKRQSIATVLGLLDTLESTLTPTLNELTALSGGGVPAIGTATPLIADIITEINRVVTTLTLLGLGGLPFEKRQSSSQVATQLASITSSIVDTLSPISSSSSFPEFGGVLTSLDVSLNGLLVAVDILVVDVTVLVSKLLVDISIELHALLLTLTAGTLGL